MSFNTDEGSIRKAFGKFGKIVNVKLPTDKMTGKPKGFGFIEFASNKEAQKAIDGLTGVEVDGRVLRLNFSGGAPAAGG